MPIGEKAMIKEITESVISNRLMEMGCIPGTPIHIEFIAPGGNPIAFNIDGYILGLRKEEAAFIVVEKDAVE